MSKIKKRKSRKMQKQESSSSDDPFPDYTEDIIEKPDSVDSGVARGRLASDILKYEECLDGKWVQDLKEPLLITLTITPQKFSYWYGGKYVFDMEFPNEYPFKPPNV